MIWNALVCSTSACLTACASLSEAAAVTSRETVGWTSVLLSKWMPGQLIWYCPFPWLGRVFFRRGLRRRIGIRKTNYVFSILTKRGPNHVFGWRTRYSDVFGRRIKYSDLSVRLPRLYVRPLGPPTPSEDILFVSDHLYQSTVGEWMLIGRLTRLRLALASNWVTLISTLNSSLKIHYLTSILLSLCFATDAQV